MKKFIIVFLCTIIVGLISCCGYLINKTITLENKINEIENKTNEIENSLKEVESTADDAHLKVINLIKILGYNPLSYQFNMHLP